MAETLKQSKESIIQARIMVTSGKGDREVATIQRGTEWSSQRRQYCSLFFDLMVFSSVFTSQFVKLCIYLLHFPVFPLYFSMKCYRKKLIFKKFKMLLSLERII